MTREEAIKALRLERGIEINGNAVRVAEFLQGLDVAISALRPVSREQVEKMRGEWIFPTVANGRLFNIPHCSICGGVPCGTDENTKFCANCGAPMTDEAVEMVMERIHSMLEV